MSRLKVDPNELKTVADSLRASAFQVYGISNKVKNMAQTNERKSINCEYVSSLHSLSDELHRQGKAIYGLATSLERISVIYGNMEDKALSHLDMFWKNLKNALDYYNEISGMVEFEKNLGEAIGEIHLDGLEKYESVAGKLSYIGTVAGVTIDYHEQVSSGEPAYSASVKTAEHFLIEQGTSAVIGGVIGTVGGPVGVVAGAVIGEVIGNYFVTPLEKVADNFYDSYEDNYVKTKAHVPYKM